MRQNRREFILSSAALISLPAFGRAASASATKFQPFSLAEVTLAKGSPFFDAVIANLEYLLRIEPDRLLHNFRVHAGLKPKGAPYGGWEADTIAGHSLGHYLTALSLIHAQTRNADSKNRANYIIDELRACQNAAGDGYVAGFTRTKDGKTEDGRVIFAELKKGEIRAAGFYLNGCWVPFYNWHKLFSGLFAAQDFCESKLAIEVAKDLGKFIADVFAALSDDQLQTVLNCEHGGINESFAELFARTNDKRWLALAERIRHQKTLGPMFAREDKLSGIHANTQIPKVIGLARLLELTGKPEYRTAAHFFWETVTQKHSYVIGGNSDREYFQDASTTSKYITDQTCESCNTYNMLKLTRRLFADEPNAAFFDYYERAHFNHMLAHQNPKTGHFAYMIPLMSGTKRDWSSDFNDFWCCVGSGMETHSKHGESVFWKAKDHLLVNLFVSSSVRWAEQEAEISVSTEYPFDDVINVEISAIKRPRAFALSVRVPAWAKNPEFFVNGRKTNLPVTGGYVKISRKWRLSDYFSMKIPMTPRFEATSDDPNVVAILNGPLVLAADLGAADRPFEGVAPALVGNVEFKPTGKPQEFAIDAARPQTLALKPFFMLWERRAAVYFPKFTDAAWREFEKTAAAEKKRLAEVESRSVDYMRLGDLAAEKEHGLVSKISYDLTYRMRPGRDARSEGFFEFSMKCDPKAPLKLQATYWGEEKKRIFYIIVDGERIATENLGYDKRGEFVEREYEIPLDLTKGKSSVKIKFEPEKGHTAGPVFGVRLFT